MFRLCIALVLTLCVTCSAMNWNFENMQGVDDPAATSEDWSDLYATAGEYIKAQSADESAFRKYVDGRVDTRVADTNCARDVALRDISIDWMVDHQAELQAKDKKAIMTACMYLRAMIDHKVQFPWQVTTYATRPIVRKLIAFLKEK